MAISKKSLGKVLAISMASAMAMSSLSAALVSVSAVQDPALASNGQVDFKTDAEDQVVALLGGVEANVNNEVDTVVGNFINLPDTLNAAAYDGRLQYTDSDGLTYSITASDITDITYRVTSGGSNLAYETKAREGYKVDGATIDIPANSLVAKSDGNATLQVKVTAEVKLGGDKNDKKFTFTHNIPVIVHKDTEIGLRAYKGDERLSNDDLNDLAAYNADLITFKLVSFHAGDDFWADVKDDVKIGDDANDGPTTDAPSVGEAVEELLGTPTGVVNENGIGVNETAFTAVENGDPVLAPKTKTGVETVLDAITEKATDNPANDNGKVLKAEKAEAPAAYAAKEAPATETAYFMIGAQQQLANAANSGLYQKLLDSAGEAGFYNKTTQKIVNSNPNNSDSIVAVTIFNVKEKATILKSDLGANAQDQLATMNIIVGKAKEVVEETENPGGDTTPTAVSKADLVAQLKKAMANGYNENDRTAVEGLVEETPTSANKGLDMTAYDAWGGVVKQASDQTVLWTDDNLSAYMEELVKETSPTVYKVGTTYYSASNVQVKSYEDGAQDTDKIDLYTIKANDQKNTSIIIFTDKNTAVAENGSSSGTQNYWATATELVFGNKDDSGTKFTADDLSSLTLTGKVAIIGTGADARYFKVTSGALDLQVGGKDVFVEKKNDQQTAVTAPIVMKAENTYELVASDAAAIVENVGELVKADGVNTKIKEPKSSAEYLTGTTGSTDEEKKASAQGIAKGLIQKAYDDAFAQLNSDAGSGSGNDANIALAAAENLQDSGVLKAVRFYAASGEGLLGFDMDDQEPGSTGKDTEFDHDAKNTTDDITLGNGKWEKGTKANDSKGYAISDNSGAGATGTAEINLSTKGSAGSGAVRAKVFIQKNINGTPKMVSEEYTLNFKTVKAVDFGSESVTIDKDGSKTIASASSNTAIHNISDLSTKSLSGYNIRTQNTVTVEDGTIGEIKITGAGSVNVNGGRTGNIVDANGVTVDGGATVGNIIDSKGNVTLSGGAVVGSVSADIDADEGEITGLVTIDDATVTSVDANCDVEIRGGEIKGNVVAEGKITISSDSEDEDGDLMDVIINGDVISKGAGRSKISIDNESDEGETKIDIRGDVMARYSDIDNEASVEIGSSNTSGAISINGAVQGEHIVLGGNGLVTLGSVNAVNEVAYSDEEGVVVDSKLEFQGFNSGIQNISNFADVVVSEGTVTVVNPLTTTTLDVQSDTEIVLASLNVEDIVGDGSIVVPAGQMVINGDVDDSPSLTLLDEVRVDTVAYRGGRGLTDKFELGGLTLRADRQTDGTYDYVVSAQELYGVKTVGKNVTLGEGQSKTVTVVADAALPEGASIVWESDDTDIATVEGNGTTATIKGVDIGAVDVTATIVDANGRDLGYENATFNVEVLYADTVNVTGSDVGPNDNQVDLDTKKKNMEAGQVYTFMVRGNNDVENISVTSGDTNVATVALANGADSRGALYNITAVADGKTDITVTYQGKTSKIAVKVGGFQLDTSSKKMAPGQVYSVLAKNVPADQAGNVTLTYDNNIVDVVKVNDNYNGRGVLFNVTAKAIGETEVKLTHNGETETMAVNVVENTGRLTLDTASYTMPFGGSYTIGVKVEKNGRQLSGEEVRAMISSGELVVTDSRTGSIVTTEVQANGNVRVTGRQNEGTTYVQFIVMQNGQRVTHASVGVTVQNGATAGGSSVRSISQW